MFEELEKRLGIAKASYAHAVGQIDAQLKGIVSRDPEQLEAAQALQAQYPVAPPYRALAAAEQPDGDAPAADVAKKPGAKKKGNQ
jgi:predicted dehydrogenase